MKNKYFDPHFIDNTLVRCTGSITVMVLFISVISNTSLASHYQCSELLGLYKQGELVEDNDRHTTFQLGRGYNGIILRVFPKNNRETFIVKLYKSNNPHVILSDLAGLEMLSKLESVPNEFEVTKVLGRPEKNVVELSDIRGFSLYEIIKEKIFSPEKTDRLMQKYRRALLAIQSGFERSPYKLKVNKLEGFETDAPTLTLQVDSPQGIINFFIKTENVVIDTNEQVTIVDSF